MNEFEFLLNAYQTSQRVKLDVLSAYVASAATSPAFNPAFDAALSKASAEADVIADQVIAACKAAAEGIDHAEPGD